MNRYKIKKALRNTTKKLEEIEYALNESSIVAITDENGKIIFVNDMFCKVSKYKSEELLGQDHRILNSSYHSKTFFKYMWKTIRAGNVWRGDLKNRAKDGTYYWVDTTIVPLLNEDHEPYQFVSIRHLITKRKKMEEKFNYLAYYDPITSIPNRNYLIKYLKQKLRSKNDKKAAILLIDIDRFKTVNDTLGHFTGDKVLKEVSNRLSGCLSGNHFLCHYGGDEFIIVLNNINNEEEVNEVASQLINELSKPITVNKQQILITASIGINISPLDLIDSKTREETIEAMIQKSDVAMYLVKKLGGNNYRYVSNQQNKQIVRQLNLENQLRRGLENNEFYLVYQPQFDLIEGKLIGVEALLRWNNKKFGLIPPNEFIPIIEKIGLINSVGYWVLNEASKQLKKWMNEGIEIKMAVNVSLKQLTTNTFVDDIKGIIQKNEIKRELLELELTESLFEEIFVIKPVLNKLRDIGISISIDDFGTGYSSLSYLDNLPIDHLKIDKSFVDKINADGEPLVKTIIDISKNLNLGIVAEGIETEEQLLFLKENKCQYGQGYYFSKPIQSNEVLHFYCNTN